jgi:hypothetical protein
MVEQKVARSVEKKELIMVEMSAASLVYSLVDLTVAKKVVQSV